MLWGEGAYGVYKCKNEGIFSMVLSFPAVKSSLCSLHKKASGGHAHGSFSVVLSVFAFCTILSRKIGGGVWSFKFGRLGMGLGTGIAAYGTPPLWDSSRIPL